MGSAGTHWQALGLGIILKIPGRPALRLLALGIRSPLGAQSYQGFMGLCCRFCCRGPLSQDRHPPPTGGTTVSPYMRKPLAYVDQKSGLALGPP